MKIKKCLILMALLTSGAANATLLTNGNFESGNIDWTLTGNIRITTSAAGDFWYGGGSAAQDGNYATVFNYGQATPNGVVSQTFATQAGSVYMVTYDYGVSRDGTQDIHASVLGSDGLTVLASQTALASNTNDQLLSIFSFSFTADGNVSKLMFADDINNNGNGVDGILDNVSVNPVVPEPASFALFALGLVGLGLTRFKRK